MPHPIARPHRHPTRRITPSRAAAMAALAAVTLIGVGGCDQEPIHSYTVEKQVGDPVAALPPGHPEVATPAGPVSTAGASHDGGLRTLAAILPAGARTWYVKLSGPAADVAHHADEFHWFVRSTTIPGPGDDPIGWTKVPDGWQRLPGERMRFATFLITDHQPPLEVTVIPLGQESGSLKANVDRWRGEVGLADATPGEMAATTRQLRIADVDATIVDLSGPGVGASGRPSPHVPPIANVPPIPQKPVEPAAAGDADDPIRVTLPAGWSKLADTPAMAVVGYGVERDGQKLITSVSRFGGDAGGVEANITRWAGQVGAAPGDAKPKAIKVDGSDSFYVDLAGPEGDANRKRVLGVIVPRAGATWFVKLIGPAAPVAAERASFEALVGSIRFNADGPGPGKGE